MHLKCNNVFVGHNTDKYIISQNHPQGSRVFIICYDLELVDFLCNFRVTSVAPGQAYVKIVLVSVQ